MMYHKPETIAAAGYSAIPDTLRIGMFSLAALQSLAIKENVTSESVTAFRINERDEWQAYLKPDAVTGYESKAILP